MTLYAIIAWLVIGLAIGGLAHLLVRDSQRTGLLRTLLLGTIGAVAGGAVTAVLVGPRHAISTFVIAPIVAALLIRVGTTCQPRPWAGKSEPKRVLGTHEKSR